MLSAASAYGIRAVTYLGAFAGDRFVPIKKLAQDLAISDSFLTKVLQALTSEGLLFASRGAHGGVKLAKTADQIKLIDIIVAIDGDALFTECMIGLPNCGQRKPCPVHEQWKPVRTHIKSMFTTQTIATLLAKTNGSKLEIVELLRP